MVDLGFGEEMYDKIIAGFQVAYGLGNLFMGWLIDRIGTKLGYLISIGVWSLSSISHAISEGAGGLRISRFFLGFGEPGNFPAAIRCLRHNITKPFHYKQQGQRIRQKTYCITWPWTHAIACTKNAWTRPRYIT